MTAILLGALAALAAVAWVLAPLFARARARPIEVPAPVAPSASQTAREIRCATCGLRPEPDARYCSTCGAPLDTGR